MGTPYFHEIAAAVMCLGPAWDVHDVARAAATMASMGNDFCSGLAAELWRQVDEWVAEHAADHEGVMRVIATTGCVPTGCSVPSRKGLLAVARSVGLRGRSTMSCAKLEEGLRAISGHVGPHCPVPVTTALAVTRLGERLINSSAAGKLYDLDRLAFREAHKVRGCPGDRGERFVFHEVRADLRRTGKVQATPALASQQARVTCEHVRRVRDRTRRAQLERELKAQGIADGGTVKSLAQMRMPEILMYVEAERDDPEVLEAAVVAALRYQHREDIERQRERQRQVARDERRAVLEAALAHHGLRLRSDSRVCHAWIETGQGNVQDVVETMLEMDWFFQHTDYSRRIGAALQAYRYERNSWRLDSDDDDAEFHAPVWNAASQSALAKREALRALKGARPIGAALPRNVKRLCDAVGVVLW
jgi:hypothetical protein